mmetsp:Transcript_97644/g.232405  ORF Transcript_97644/g.232405 Transcript_97644/m.232405 type:complete len:612 (+) Transcript_97644:67-1902(+)
MARAFDSSFIEEDEADDVRIFLSAPAECTCSVASDDDDGRSRGVSRQVAGLPPVVPLLHRIGTPGLCLFAVCALMVLLGLLQAGRGNTAESQRPATELKLFADSDATTEMQRQADLLKEKRIVDTLGAVPNFLWGTATSAYQVEGAWDEGGRSESIWDVFCHNGGAIDDASGDVSCNFYSEWKSDLGLLSLYGFNTYRFSISWTRVLPFINGTATPNQEGIDFYRKVLAELMARGITPMVTMYHWDLPKELDWREPEVVEHFVSYAKFLLTTFPEVKLWMTINEPFSFCFLGYHIGVHAPGVESKYDQFKCGHHVILAHAKTFEMFRNLFHGQSGYKMGIVINYDFPEPLHPDDKDDVKSVEVDALQRIGWFADPLFFGDYPEELKLVTGKHLPRFTAAEQELLKSGANHPMSIYGLNTYGGRYVSAKQPHHKHDSDDHGDHDDHGDQDVDPLHPQERFFKDGKPIGDKFIGAWLYKVPEEMLLHLRWVNQRYQPHQIYITENGCPDPGHTQYAWTVDDSYRISFFRDYLAKVAEAVEEGIPVQGYVVWSLLDNFEWADGYSRRFGLTYVDFGTQKRTPKASALWWRKLNRKLGTEIPHNFSESTMAQLFK